MTTFNKEDVKGIECRFATYIPPSTDENGRSNNDDFHLIKEQVHLKDGRVVPHVRFVKNFKMPVYTTKIRYRDHQQKREKEKIERLDKWETTRANMTNVIAKALTGETLFRGDPRKLMESPYLYGTDLSSTAYIKQRYLNTYKDFNSYYSVAVFDTETSMFDAQGTILCATLSFKDKAISVVRKDFVSGIHDPVKRIHAVLNTYLGDYIKKRNINWEVLVVDEEIEIVQEIFKRAHEWRPDFIAGWNIDFDIQKCIDACERAKVDPKYIFSDPGTPKGYEFFKYKKGPVAKTSNKGITKKLAPYEQWHWVECPASFLFIDSMCVYYLNRIAEQNEPSYKLDYLLEKHLGVRKLKFKESNHLTENGPAWHKFMQSHYPMEYVAYNGFDCIGVEEFDEKVLDLCMTTPAAAGCTDFSRFNSQPQRLLTQVYWFLFERDYILGNGAGVKDDFDDMTIGLDGWICTLPAHLISEKGLRSLNMGDSGVVSDLNQGLGLRTNTYILVGDLDVASGYPKGTCCFNTSRETTKKEIVEIEGIPKHVSQLEGINLSGGHNNAIYYSTQMLGLPTLFQLDDYFREGIKPERNR